MTFDREGNPTPLEQMARREAEWNGRLTWVRDLTPLVTAIAFLLVFYLVLHDALYTVAEQPSLPIPNSATPLNTSPISSIAPAAGGLVTTSSRDWGNPTPMSVYVVQMPTPTLTVPQVQASKTAATIAEANVLATARALPPVCGGATPMSGASPMCVWPTATAPPEPTPTSIPLCLTPIPGATCRLTT